MAVTNPQNTEKTDLRGDAQSRLLASALKLFAAKGYDATSVREIIEDASVTRPVLYYYFKNKEDLFCHLVEAQFHEVYRQIDEIIETIPDCRGRLKALVTQSFGSAKTSPEIVRLLLRYFFAPPDQPMRIDKDALAAERFARIVEVMRKGIEDAELKREDPEILAMGFSGMMDIFVMANVGNPDFQLNEENGHALVELFMDGASA